MTTGSGRLNPLLLSKSITKERCQPTAIGEPSLRKTAAQLSKLIRRDPLSGLLAAAAWATFAFIVFSTLAPLHLRPVVTRNADLERFAAFAMLGLLFGLAYPHRRIADLSFVVSAAGVLEILQLITRDRHGHLLDAVIKAVGGTSGIGLSIIILAVAEYYQLRFLRPSPANEEPASNRQISFFRSAVQNENVKTKTRS
jgi:hypothetical protein